MQKYFERTRNMKSLSIGVCLLLFLSSVLCDTSQCQVVCRKTKAVEKNNLEIFLEFKRSVIKLPDNSNYVEENRMHTLPNGEIIPEVSLRLPSQFTVEPVAANCASKEVLSEMKELRKNIKCAPRPVIVDIISTDGRVHPNKVLTKQCSGLCTGQKVCTAVKTQNISFPVQVIPVYGKRKITCSTILVPQDTKCRCKCSVTKKNCNAKQKYDKQSCSCKCKNEVEQAHCLKKSRITQQHVWDPDSCSCVCMHEAPCTTGTFWDKTTCRCSRTGDNG